MATYGSGICATPSASGRPRPSPIGQSGRSPSAATAAGSRPPETSHPPTPRCNYGTSAAAARVYRPAFASDAAPTDITFSPDGTKLAAAAIDPEGATAIEIFSVPQLVQLKTLPAGAGTSLRFSPDGRLLVLGDIRGRLWLYDTHTWRPRGTQLVAHTGAVVTVSFSPDGRTLATTSDDGTARLWDVPSGHPIGTALPGPAQHYIAAAFVDGGTHLATLDDEGHGSLWDIQPKSWARRACQVAGRKLTHAEWDGALPERTVRPRVRTPLTARRSSSATPPLGLASRPAIRSDGLARSDRRLWRSGANRRCGEEPRRTGRRPGARSRPVDTGVFVDAGRTRGPVYRRLTAANRHWARGLERTRRTPTQRM